ncbi:hypothetical protein [Corynebacterium hadale]|uniref:hypothetical protein n=1 Tax=Corynebacterium hadale TaxID=2026255 RepID=UPI0013FD2A28|nr:hypothetical protein [Corynebacterium hadale]
MTWELWLVTNECGNFTFFEIRLISHVQECVKRELAFDAFFPCLYRNRVKVAIFTRHHLIGQLTQISSDSAVWMHGNPTKVEGILIDVVNASLGESNSARRLELFGAAFGVVLPILRFVDFDKFSSLADDVIGVPGLAVKEPWDIGFSGPLGAHVWDVFVHAFRRFICGLRVRRRRSCDADCCGAGDSQRSCHGCGEGRAKINLAGGEDRPHVGSFLRRRLTGRISPGNLIYGTKLF